jgi:hypothetical protein
VSLLTPAPLATFRDRNEGPATLAAFAVGLLAVLAATVVPAIPPATGLVVGGLAVGLVAASLRRALVLGVYFGAAVLVCWVAGLLLFGVFGAVAGAWPLSALAVVLGLALPTLSALAIRGLV